MSNSLERERIEILRDLKRVISLIMEHQHETSTALTENDPAVTELLVWIERSLWHGLRKVLLNDSTLSHVTLWNVIVFPRLVPVDLGTNEAEDRAFAEFSQIKQQVLELDLKTGSGRSRAWTRLALNAGVLGHTMAWLQEGADVSTFYEPVSLWRSTEQRSLLLALFASLRGMKFNLDVKNRLVKLDTDPEPSRRPHFLGISSMKRQPASATGGGSQQDLFPPPPQTKTGDQVHQQVMATKQREREEVNVLRNKMQFPPPAPAPAPASTGVVSWFKDALFGPAPPPAAAQSVVDLAKPLTPLPPAPSFLGSTLTALVRDKRTGDEYCLLDYRLCMPKALSSLLAIIRLDDTSQVLDDLFDPRHVALEDDPRFVKEVGSLISRLSNRKSKQEQDELIWDGGPPSLVAIACLRLFFRQLPQPIIPFDSYDALCSCQQIGEEDAKVRNISFLIESIPDTHKPALVAVLQVIKDKIDSKQTTAISAANSLAPGLVRPRPEYGSFAKSGEGAELVLLFLEHFDEIFGHMTAQLDHAKQALKLKVERIEQMNVNFKLAVNWTAQDELYAKRLWVALAPQTDTHMFAPISDGWLARGFRTTHFATDFRGCGFAALEHLVYLAEEHNTLARELLQRFLPQASSSIGMDHSVFPFIAGGAQISYMMCEFLGLSRVNPLDVKQVAEWTTIWPLLDEERASAKLFVVLMRFVDMEWTRQGLRAMEFNKFVREVRIHLEDLVELHRPKSIRELYYFLFNKPQEEDEPRAAVVVTTQDLPSSSTAPVPVVRLDSDLLPKLICPFKSAEEDGVLMSLTSAQVSALEQQALPAEFRGYDWEMVFSSTAHGFNLHAFFQQCQAHEATILALRDVSGAVFGAFCNETWRNGGDLFYGSPQTSLWAVNLEREGGVEVYKWTQRNNFFMLANEDCIALGQGNEGAFAIYLDGDLNKGTSGPSSTFGNTKPLLDAAGKKLIDGINAEVTCQTIEVWSFIPKTVAKRRE